MQSLVEIREDNWTVIFNEEDELEEQADENDIMCLINELCSS